MSKSTFVAIRATPDDKAMLAECAKLARSSYSEAVRVALRRYLADLRKRR